jgi:type II secretory pathway pseudopilin PulG
MPTNRGFALLEAVIALAIVGLIGVGALSSMGAQSRTADRARDAVEAAALAEYRLASLQLLSADELSPLPDSLSYGRFAPPLDQYAWRATARPTSDEDGLYELTVKVEWGDGSFSLATQVYRPDRGGP